jgi:dipeptidyl aminopeptidase/acylaminoacyl peptidase
MWLRFPKPDSIATVKAMQTHTTMNDRLDSWKDIASHLNRNIRTVIRWEKDKGLPVHRVPGGKRQAVFGYRHEIDRWLQTHTEQNGTGPAVISGAVQPIEVSRPNPSSVSTAQKRNALTKGQVVLLTSVLAVTGLAALGWGMVRQPILRITGVQLLNSDGTEKTNLVTDGKQLYFAQVVGDREILSTIPVSGGPIQRMEGAPANSRPVDVSQDGKHLLVLSYEGKEEEHQLWITPTSGAASYPVPGVRCQAAAWSPDGRWIAYAAGASIYLIDPNASGPHSLGSFGGIPALLAWSADGKRLLFVLRDASTLTNSLWQLPVGSNASAGSAVLLHAAWEHCCDRFSRAPGSDTFFASANSRGQELWAVRPSSWWQAAKTRIQNLAPQLGAIAGIAPDGNARKIFVLVWGRAVGNLVRYDSAAHGFMPFLPGVQATYVDFNRNNSQIAYVRPSDDSLWISLPDGQQAKQLSPAGMMVELPRWSPDGSQIAFTGKLPDQPWRIYLLPAAGGSPKEASSGTDNQGAPTWSPDGRLMTYGNVMCQENNSCAIHTINLATGDVATLPQSQGLGTARWSPDGRFIAALDPSNRELYVYCLSKHTWQRVAQEANGDDLSWSADSRFLYTNRWAENSAEIVKVPVAGGPLETALDLGPFSRQIGSLDTWFCLSPDGSILVHQSLHGSEIYALSYSKE